MSLRFAMLGLLARQPMSGYDLTKAFHGSLAYVWSARHSQIYPELAALQLAGLIRQVAAGPRGRKEYAITDAGRDELGRWLHETTPDRTVRDESFLRVFFLWLMEPDRAREYLRGEARYHRGKLEQYERIAASPPSDHPAERSARISLEAGIRHERTLAEWAEWAERQLLRPQATARRRRNEVPRVGAERARARRPHSTAST